MNACYANPGRGLLLTCGVWSALLLALLLGGTRLKSVKAQEASVGRPGYAGDAACVSCHRNESATYLQTAHHLTSQLPSEKSIHGSFQAGANSLTIIDPSNSFGEPSLMFKMESKERRFSETAITGFAPTFQSRTENIDIVTGSGKRGQTFLYWQRDRLFELPISYWSDGKQWINSPGYRNGTADFSRPVNPACMECHSSYLQALSIDPSTNSFRRDSFVPGISCETCHGPGAAHVAERAGKSMHTPKTPDATILNPARFSRDRQMEVCAYCHNGIQREQLAPAFSFVPGRPLSVFFKPIPAETAEHPDVHGNQVGLLERSRCFLNSPSMTCSTCHNTHAPEQAAQTYSTRCLTCHQVQQCGVARKLGHAAATNCIDCHMPVEPTAVIVSETAGKEVHATMRNHWIKIYPNAHLP